MVFTRIQTMVISRSETTIHLDSNDGNNINAEDTMVTLVMINIKVMTMIRIMIVT